MTKKKNNISIELVNYIVTASDEKHVCEFTNSNFLPF